MLSPAPDSLAAIPLVPLGRAQSRSLSKFHRCVEKLGHSHGLPYAARAEVLCHGDAERALSTLVALHSWARTPCEPLSIEEAHEMEPALGREARSAAFFGMMPP